MMDPYGELIDAKMPRLGTKSLSYDDYYDVLKAKAVKAREKIKEDNNPKGWIPKSDDEVKVCLNAYKKLTKELSYT